MLNTRRYRKRNRELVVAYLADHHCVDCGESDVRVLDFDHVNGAKEFNISNFISRGGSWRRIEAEIEKCQVRCANCHRRKTALDYGWYKGSVGGV